MLMRVKARSEYGERLYQARTYAKLSQVELATRAKLAQSTLAGLEKSGQGSEKTATLAEICGVSPRWLEAGEGPMLPELSITGDAPPAIGPGGVPDYRAIMLAMADAVKTSGSPISVPQFVALVEATYSRLSKGK